MSHFPFHPSTGRTGPSGLRSVFVSALLWVAGLGCALPLQAQWPGEVRGRVVDELTGDGIPGADVYAASLGRGLQAGTDGAFHLRGLEPGEVRLRVSALGYADEVATVEVRNGRVADLVVRLPPAALPLRGVDARARRSRGSAGEVLDVTERGGVSAGTLGGLLEGVPGLSVRRRGAGGSETVSIRGSDADEVLVLLDGAPLNDPLTGAADLSTVPASSVERITVLRGARSARYGSRAQAGAVVVETRSASSPARASFSAGSLGRWIGRAEGSARPGPLRLGGSASAESADGGFAYEKPEAIGGGTARRTNADRTRVGATGTAEADVSGGALSLRVGGELLDRGIPGKSFAPSDSARQRMRRVRAALRWAGPAPGGRLSASTYGVAQRVRFRDSAPPLGRPYDDRTALERTGGRLELEGTPGPTWTSPVAVGVDLHHTRVRSDALADDGPEPRTDAAGWSRGGLAFRSLPGSPRVDAALRLHRDAARSAWRASHEVTLSARSGGVALDLSHRSAFSPPTLGDQFFREGVGVRPNPDLRAERIPSEVELGASWSGRPGGLSGEVAAAAYAGDVRDKIVWAPDFRFVWSPRNVDVKRRGAEIRGTLRDPVRGLSLEGSLSRSRVVYDRPGPDTVQLRYRPRHTASLRATWEREDHRVGVAARYLGTRYPVPTPFNALSPFWTVDLDARRDWRLGRWTVRTGLRVERLLDETGSFFFGFPDPGRTVLVSLEVRPP